MVMKAKGLQHSWLAMSEEETAEPAGLEIGQAKTWLKSPSKKIQVEKLKIPGHHALGLPPSLFS